MKNIAIFASGNGTNCENIIRYFSSSKEINISIVVCNNKKAKVIERAKRYNVPVCIISKEELDDEEKFLQILKEHDVSIIVLAGFMLFIPTYLTQAYPKGIINIHPSLLPKYGGKGMYGMHVHEAVRLNHEKESGITIHYVNNEYDKGQIIRQHSVSLSESDTAEDIAQKVHNLEYKYFPETIEEILKEKE